jgi:hypothetical protein
MLAGGLLAALLAFNGVRTPKDECSTGTCIVVEGDAEGAALTVVDVGSATLTQHYARCRLGVNRPDGPGGIGFKASTSPSTGEITILDGALGKVLRCENEDGRVRAVLQLNPPEYAWAVPAPGHVFVPFDDDTWGARLPDFSFARARAKDLDPRGVPVEGSGYCITSGYTGATTTRCDVQVGDTFRWGTHDAAIVRIVEPRSPFAGWIEVALR